MIHSTLLCVLMRINCQSDNYNINTRTQVAVVVVLTVTVVVVALVVTVVVVVVLVELVVAGCRFVALRWLHLATMIELPGRCLYSKFSDNLEINFCCLVSILLPHSE